VDLHNPSSLPARQNTSSSSQPQPLFNINIVSARCSPLLLFFHITSCLLPSAIFSSGLGHPTNIQHQSSISPHHDSQHSFHGVFTTLDSKVRTRNPSPDPLSQQLDCCLSISQHHLSHVFFHVCYSTRRLTCLFQHDPLVNIQSINNHYTARMPPVSYSNAIKRLVSLVRSSILT
jgi:hypothetical protein